MDAALRKIDGAPDEKMRHGGDNLQAHGQPMGQPPPASVATYCAEHDCSEKRIKTEPQLRKCIACGIERATNYRDFTLCPFCSASQHKCMICGQRSVTQPQCPEAHTDRAGIPPPPVPPSVPNWLPTPCKNEWSADAMAREKLPPPPPPPEPRFSHRPHTASHVPAPPPPPAVWGDSAPPTAPVHHVPCPSPRKLESHAPATRHGPPVDFITDVSPRGPGAKGHLNGFFGMMCTTASAKTMWEQWSAKLTL